MKQMTVEELTAWFEDYGYPVSCYGHTYHIEHKGLFFTLNESGNEEDGYVQKIIDTNIDCEENGMKAVLISIATINGIEDKLMH